MNNLNDHLVGIQGFFRIQFIKNKKIVCDLGWKKNQITNNGILKFLINRLLSSTEGKTIGWMSLGIGNPPRKEDIALEHEISTRVAIKGTAVGSNIARFTALFPFSYNKLEREIFLSNIGLFDSNIAKESTLFSGGAISPKKKWIENQTVKVTYDIEFTSI